MPTLQALFKRFRRPGDIVFAWVAFAFAAFLLLQITGQTEWKGGKKIFSEPAFWPAVSLSAMTGFAALHLLGSALSPRIAGRWVEVAFWARSAEFVLWFLAYVLLVPRLGYLFASVLVAVLLTLRCGYRSRTMLIAAIGGAAIIVVIFKSFLQVMIPGGAIYEALPGGLRQFMLTYF